MDKDFLLSIVVPVYKEEANIRPFVKRTAAAMEKIGCRYEILFVLDPSPDATYDEIRSCYQENGNVRLIQTSRRFGQPAASMCGILNCGGDACVVIDVDLQDPPELIETMVEKWQEGHDVVCAQRSSRKGESALKLLITKVGYAVIHRLSEVNIPTNTGDFRLMYRKVIEGLRSLNEHNGFLRGLVSWVGYDQICIPYERDARLSGKGNYNRFTGSWKIGLNGIICFSTAPLQIMTGMGAFFTALGVLLCLWYLIQKIIIGAAMPLGMSGVIVILVFFSGLIIFCMGLLGEYIGRIYDEAKGRPLYIIDKKENFNDESRKGR